MPGLLDLPASVIEQIAKVQLDEGIDYIWGSRDDLPKFYCFWVLREVGHRGVHAAAWEARHSVVRADLRSTATLGDLEWTRVILARGEHSQLDKDMAAVDAAYYGHTAVLAVLLDSGVHVEAPSADMSPLSAASCGGHTETARFLIGRGADVHPDGQQPLRLAARNGWDAVVAILFWNGADPLAVEEDGYCRLRSSAHAAPGLTRGAGCAVAVCVSLAAVADPSPCMVDHHTCSTTPSTSQKCVDMLLSR